MNFTAREGQSFPEFTDTNLTILRTKEMAEVIHYKFSDHYRPTVNQKMCQFYFCDISLVTVDRLL